MNNIGEWIWIRIQRFVRVATEIDNFLYKIMMLSFNEYLIQQIQQSKAQFLFTVHGNVLVVDSQNLV